MRLLFILLTFIMVVAVATSSKSSSEDNYQERFISTIKACLKAHNSVSETSIPESLVIAQGAIESNWGRSRFATEGNALFGVRTYDLSVPHMKPLNNLHANFGVKIYESSCDSVSDYLILLETSHHYEGFRQTLTYENYTMKDLVYSLEVYSENSEYPVILLSITRKF